MNTATNHPLFLSVSALVKKLDKWKSVHESHVSPMRTALKNASIPELAVAANEFTMKVEQQGWQFHESHLADIRAALLLDPVETVGQENNESPAM